MTLEQRELGKFDKKLLCEGQSNAMAMITLKAKEFVEAMLNHVPVSADRSAAIRYARLAAMQANASIAHEWENMKDD